MLPEHLFAEWEDQPSTRANWLEFRKTVDAPYVVRIDLEHVRKFLDDPHKDLNELGKHMGQLQLMQETINDIAKDVPWAVVRELREPLNDMLRQLENIQTELALGRVAARASRPERVRTGTRGAPRLNIDMHALLEMYHDGFTYREIASELGVVHATIHNRLRECGLGANKFSLLTMGELRDAIFKVYDRGSGHQGYRMVHKHLESQGLHVQQDVVQWACATLASDDVWRRGQRVTLRRRYRVPYPNSLWHFDGHHKLIRWKMVIHGCIDGFSRRLIWLAVKNNNRAQTVAELFDEAIELYGVPSRVRCDHGGENVLVGHRMEEIRGVEDSRGHKRGSFIQGPSTRNQRIERIWVDLQLQCTDRFYTTFNELENDGLLDRTRPIEVWCLHFVYMPVIQMALDAFVDTWDVHGIRTEGYRSPRRLWRLGVIMAARRGLNLEQKREEILRARAPLEDMDFPDDVAERTRAFEEYCVDDIGREDGPNEDKDPHVQVIPPHELVEPSLHALLASQSFIDALEQVLGPPVLGNDAHTLQQFLTCKAVIENMPSEMMVRFIRSG